MSEDLTVSVVIPTLNAASRIGRLVDALQTQSLRPEEIIVIDSESDDGTADVVDDRSGVTVLRIRRRDFNHGTTRHMGLLRARGSVVCFLTDDALPVDSGLLERLVAPMRADPDVALVTARQVPRPEASRAESLVRAFNYGDTDIVRTIDDVERLGVKAFHASNTCSAYRVSAYKAVGGFPPCATNEDMLLASRLLAGGYKTAYCSAAAVYHSHDFTLAQQFKRNRAIGRFLEQHSEDFVGASEVGEGGRLVHHVASVLVGDRRYWELARFGADCAARLAGNRLGRFEGRFLDR